MGQKVTLPTGQYQVIGKCYMASIPGQFPTMYDPGNARDPIIVYFDGVPGPHLRPLDQAAHNNMAVYNQQVAERERRKQNPLHSLRSITDIPQHRMPLVPPAPASAAPPPPAASPMPPAPPANAALADMLDTGDGPAPLKNKGGRPKGSGGRPKKR